MQRLEVSGAVRLIYGSLGVKRLTGLVLLDTLTTYLALYITSSMGRVAQSV